MTREDIMRMAKEVWSAGYVHERSLERFAALVAAHEREACAKVCEARYMGDNSREDMEARRCAEAIRKRGEK
jgi:hypothetical protein